MTVDTVVPVTAEQKQRYLQEVEQEVEKEVEQSSPGPARLKHDQGNNK